MTLKNGEKFEEELTYHFKIDTRNLTNFDTRTQSLKNLHFNGLLLTKLNNAWAKKVQMSYVWLHLGLIQSLRENWPVFPKTDMRNLENFHQSQSLQIGTVMTHFCLKLKMHEIKTYRGVMCHGNEEWCKNWRGIDLSVQNWYEEFDKFWPEHSKISKICILMDHFWPRYISFELKNYRGVMFDGTEYWWETTEKWLVLSKMTWWNEQIFTRACSEV